MKTIQIIIATFIFGVMSLTAAPFFGSVIVGTSEVQLKPGTPAATSVVIQNPPTAVATVYLNYTASTNAVTTITGVALVPGASFLITATPAANPARNKITAISTGTTAVIVQYDDAKIQ